MDSVTLNRYFSDLENRLDDAEELRVERQWLDFADLKLTHGAFRTGRTPKPSAIDWPKMLVNDALDDADIRTQLDERNEKIGYKIREARQIDRVPYMLILGAKEAEEGTVSVRNRDTDETVVMKLDDFIAKVKDEIATRAH